MQGFGQEIGGDAISSRLVVLGDSGLFRRRQLLIGVERFDDPTGNRAQIEATGQRGQRRTIVPGEVLVQPGQPAGDG